MAATGIAGPDLVSGQVSESPVPFGHRQKRRQVARACDGCRISRIKCDDNSPCSNCRAKGRHCSNNSATRATTLSQAHDEMARLRQRVQELQLELEQERDKTSSLSLQELTPPNSSTSPFSPPRSNEVSHGSSKKKFGEGIQLRPARSPHHTWFGPSSLYHFIARLSSFLSPTLEQSHLAHDMLPQTASSSKLVHDKPVTTPEIPHRSASSGDSSNTGMYLNPIQEEYFINLFWQSYHTSLCAIINEEDFKKHYQSLWIPSSNTRKASALVDIIIAMCMQYGMSTRSSPLQCNIIESNDTTIAGRWHYQRGQMLLAGESESPTTSTLQCHLLCAIYLCGGSFHNMVDSACGAAVRTAYQLGLHLEAPSSMSERNKQMRRRLWWSVYLLDSKVGMKLGRPFLLNDSYAMPELPGDQLEAAIVSGSTFAPIGDNATWLSFNLHLIKLYATMRAAHTAFYSKDLDLYEGQTIYDDPRNLETLAEVFLPHSKALAEWVDAVPKALKTTRQNGGTPYSTDGSSLEIEQYAPVWLQRQRVLLEMTYHHLSVSLYRPFISFVSSPIHGGFAETLTIKCASHAIELSKITQQMHSSTSILDGWGEAFQWQWSAAMTLIGFILAYPQGETTPTARSAIDLAVSFFDVFGVTFATAASAADIMRNLCSKIDSLLAKTWGQQSLSGTYQSHHGTSVTNFTDMGQDAFVGNELAMGGLMENSVNFQAFSDGLNGDLFDMAVGVDFWQDLNLLWPGNMV